MKKLLHNPGFYIFCFLLSVVLFITFLLVEGGNKPGLWSKNVVTTTFQVVEVGICTGGRHSSCAYSVSNEKEYWNISSHRAMNKGWTMSRTRWTTLLGNPRELWQ